MTDTTSTRCSICLHPESEAISAAILSGVELRAIAARWDGSISTSALSRHATAHLRPALRDAARDSAVAPTDLLLRLIDIADSARSARLRAESGGTPVQQTRASDLEVKVLGALLTSYGVSATSTAEALADAERLVRSVAKFATEHPAAARDLIGVIRSQGLDQFANNLDSIVFKKSRTILERTTQ